MLSLAAPLILAELGWMTMGIVDTMMVGRLPDGALAISGASIGSVMFVAVAFFGAGLFLGLDALVSQAFGAGDLDDCHRSLANAVHLAAALTPLLIAVTWISTPLMEVVGVQPAVIAIAVPYLQAMLWSTFPLLLYFALRRYLQAMNLVRPVTFALVSANLINAIANWALIYGNLGAPALGVEGAGWATCFSRAYLALALLGYVLYHEQRYQMGLARAAWLPDLARIKRILALGFPAAGQMLAEIGVFALATAIIGRLDKASLASHQIALNVVSYTYMVPLGVSSATAVRVGQALGRRDAGGAARAGWTGLAIGAGFMGACALLLWTLPYQVIRLFTPDATVLAAGAALLVVGAVFQIFDGLQVVATGALRGAGDTQTPMLTSVIAYWVIGLPLGTLLCFRWHWGATGIWMGLSLGLILMGCVLLLVWRRRVRLLAAAFVPAVTVE
jgi:MATE family multidrug resistance protein